MRAVLLLAVLAFPGIAFAAPAPKLCVRASESSQYNVRPIGPHDLWMANAVGDRTPVRVTTSCIHIWAGAYVGVYSPFQCVGLGDQVTVQDMMRRPERCRVSGVAPFVPGTEAEGYR